MKPPRAWRSWILGWVFLAFIGLQAIEATHHHDSAAAEEACLICQAAAHHPFDLTQPVAAPIGALLFLLFFLPVWRPAIRIAKTCCAAYDSRAPPSRTA